MRRDALLLQRWAYSDCCRHVLPHDLLDGIAAQSLVTITDEQGFCLVATALDKPATQHLGTVLTDWCCALLAPLAEASYVRARPSHNVAAQQVDQLRDAQARLQGE